MVPVGGKPGYLPDPVSGDTQEPASGGDCHEVIRGQLLVERWCRRDRLSAVKGGVHVISSQQAAPTG